MGNRLKVNKKITMRMRTENVKNEMLSPGKGGSVVQLYRYTA